jgi:branched-subunit amino acid aminotransferase/4-amino-4-deoxychorismate lyase
VVFEICQELGCEIRETNITLDKLRTVDEVFVSLSSSGVVEVASVENHPARLSPLFQNIIRAYGALIAREGL